MGRQTAAADVSDSQLGPVSTFSVQAGKAKIVLSVLKVRCYNCCYCCCCYCCCCCCCCFLCVMISSARNLIMKKVKPKVVYDRENLFDFVLYLIVLGGFPCIVRWH